jgi:mxaJ protein
MRRNGLGLPWLLLLLALCLAAGTVRGEEELKELRVCADPANLPFSNQKLEGFENKIATLLAQDLGLPLTYYWWPHQRGLVRSFLNTGQCDVLISIPTGYDPVLWTKPYYRTGYVIASLKERNIAVTSLDDPRLRQFTIGVHVNTPPHDVLANHGIIGSQVVTYDLFYDPRIHPEDYPGRILEDLLAGKMDVAVVWGPIAGYFARKQSVPLTLTPLQGRDGGIPFTFAMSVGVRKQEQDLKARLEASLERQQAEVQKILTEYGVPLLPVAEKGS